jgi:2-methylaconitate cis-trans-isomerase PrpF
MPQRWVPATFVRGRGPLPRADGEARVRLHNTNTGRLVHARFAVLDGRLVGAVVSPEGGWRAERATLYRTARPLLRGAVAVPAR